MPIVQIYLVEGRDIAAVKACMQEVAQAVHRSLGAPLNTVRVMVQQLPPAQWSIGGMSRDEIDAAKSGAPTPTPTPTPNQQETLA
jgi:4-oxalocrotonate tautomerase